MIRRIIALIVSFIAITVVNGQGFKCDGSIFVVSYTESEGISRLYKVRESNREFSYVEIPLSDNRRLSGLSYHVLDEHLYALDVDSYQLVKISSTGLIQELGVPATIDGSYTFNSGTISADGSGILLFGYSNEFGFDDRFYTINLNRTDFIAQFLGVTGLRSEMGDLATDPTSGLMYGYDNSEGRLVQVAIGGAVSGLDYPATGITDIDGVFFNQQGEFFAFSPNGGMYFVDKNTGLLTRLSKKIEGTNGDACSCPYTYTFDKNVEPREILPCQEFEVTYTFHNSLGIGQTWVTFVDSFPPGFEILSVEGNVIFPYNIVPSKPNVLSLENIIYLMRSNEIKVKVRAPDDFFGDFGTQAVHWDFPKAFSEFQYTNDPSTDVENDETIASVISSSELDLTEQVHFNCKGDAAIINAPFDAEEYLWSTGETTRFIQVDQMGTYVLTAINDCVTFLDSVDITSFVAPKEILVSGDTELVLGTETTLTVSLTRGTPEKVTWLLGQDTLITSATTEAVLTPFASGDFTVLVLDTDGCLLETMVSINVEVVRDFYAPNVFSPNNDLINDNFSLNSSYGGEIKKFKVFNRWGNEVFAASDIPMNDTSVGWDGKINGMKASPGVYIWMAEIEYDDGFSERRSASVTILEK